MSEINVSKRYQNSQTLSEVLDPNKVILRCGLHNYVAGSGLRKHTGCKQCIMADFVKMFAEMPADVREERLDHFEALVHAMCELEDEGKLDLSINRNVEIKVESDGLPD